MRVLFVTNGHGEAAIAARIASELRACGPLETDHFPLVGDGFESADLPTVGPRAAMPSGGLVAMGNAAAFARDVRAGFLGLWAAQRRFLRTVRGRYAALAAVGDVYGYAMARLARAPTVFVGTAKSEHVAPYGAIERAIVRSAGRIFVRDEPTAEALRARGVRAEAANVIVDLAGSERSYPWAAGERLVLLPGSREEAYGDAVLLASVVASLPGGDGREAVLSVAPSLDLARVARGLERDGWVLDWEGELFRAGRAGAPPLAASREDLGTLFAGATLALGQAGTANEAAAACGLPVVALETRRSGRRGWYRMRQSRLLGGALEVVPGEPRAAAAAVEALLDDPVRRAAMGRIGRERMGPPGGAAAVARALAEVAAGGGFP